MLVESLALFLPSGKYSMNILFNKAGVIGRGVFTGVRLRRQVLPG